MKKTILVCASAILAGSLLTGCSLFGKANGLILYGDEQQVSASVAQEKDKIVEESQYPIKIAKDGKEQVMILSEDTAQELVDKELLRKVVEGIKTETVTSVPEGKKGEAVLFAKKQQKELELDGQALDVSYEGNLVIGDGRAYVDKFLVVDQSNWESIEGEDKAMAVMKYKKNLSEKTTSFDVDTNQLVKIGD